MVTVFGAGVDTTVAETGCDAPVEYFNLQGMKVDNPSGGIFIRKCGDKAEKIVVK